MLPTILLLAATACSSARVARETALLGERYAMYGFRGVVLVSTGGKVVLDRGFGGVTRDTRFDPGSIMKTFVAAAMLRLEADGRLRTSDRISKYLGPLPAEKEAITIDQLLLHTSGLPLDAPPTTVDVVAALREAKLRSAPGAEYSYSNFGYGVALQIVERVSGQPFAVYARKQLLEPAQMRESRFWTEEPRPGEVMAKAWSGNSDEELTEAEEPKRLAPESPMWGKYIFGAGGLVTTAADLHRWWRALQESEVLPRDVTKKMFTAAIEGQGYGWNIKPPKIYRGGLIRGAFISMLAAWRDAGAVLVYLIDRNTGWHAPLEKNVERIVRHQPHVVPPAVVTMEPPARAIGTFGGVRITRDGNDLLVAGESQEALSLLWSMSAERRAVAARLNEQTEGEVLGTAPHPSSSRNYQTFVRKGDTIVRVISDGDKVLTTATGVPRSAMRRFRMTAPNTLASYDVANDRVLTLTLHDDTIELTNGAERLAFRSATRADERPPAARPGRQR
ncbi:MAG TPA: serine hydrolase domain-containing protein [Thermoanaerobaculia bacterium]|jgi:CubicO group peptidase (beta-lactamase class C family)